MHIQIQTDSLSKTGSKVVITINGKTNGYSGLLAVDGSSTDQHTLRVAGTITLKRGWTTSVKIFTTDKNWMAKSSSGFSCHLLKTSNGCTAKQSAQSLAQVFAFVEGQMSNTSNRTSRADTTVPALPTDDVDGVVSHPVTATKKTVDVAMGVSCIFACSFAVITLSMQIHYL